MRHNSLFTSRHGLTSQKTSIFKLCTSVLNEIIAIALTDLEWQHLSVLQSACEDFKNIEQMAVVMSDTMKNSSSHKFVGPSIRTEYCTEHFQPPFQADERHESTSQL